jgi:Ni,Fe-hydrogenase III small subunit
VTSGWSGKQQKGLWLSIIFGLHLKVLTTDAEVQGCPKTPRNFLKGDMPLIGAVKFSCQPWFSLMQLIADK